MRRAQVTGDLGAATFDLVATNPPYRTLAGSRRPPDDERALRAPGDRARAGRVGRVRRPRGASGRAGRGDLPRRARRRSARRVARPRSEPARAFVPCIPTRASPRRACWWRRSGAVAVRSSSSRRWCCSRGARYTPEVRRLLDEGVSSLTASAAAPLFLAVLERLVDRRQVVEVRDQRDLDAPVLRLVLGRVVGGDRRRVRVAGGRDALGLHAGADHEVQHLDGARRRQVPVGPELRALHRHVVGVAGDLEVAVRAATSAPRSPA